MSGPPPPPGAPEPPEPDAPRGPLDFDPAERWAHRRDPDLDAPPEAGGPKPPARTPASRYGWVVGIIALVAILYITINTLRTTPSGSRGPRVGRVLPPFAMPLALSSLNGDSNVARRADQGSAGKRPACQVRGPAILNVCQLAQRGPVVLAFLAVRGGGRCIQQLDRIEQIRDRYPEVQFAAVAIRGDRGDLRSLIREHGWGFPVGYDRDGAVANLYGVAVCPTITFARRGGVVARTTIGELSEFALGVAIRRVDPRAR